ncbi:MAG: shikimate dehydrogenase [Planctomycetes bacterium]|nr:shikimate dehydrogenase [Planctomycetota bacterium]
MSYLTVSISGCDVKEMSSRAVRAKSAGADLLELRADHIEGLDWEKAKHAIKSLLGTGLGLIVTCRDKSEGGAGDWSLEERIGILSAAAGKGARFIDCEYANFVRPGVREQITSALADNPDCRLILSAHNFEGPFDDLEGLRDEIKNEFPAAIPKLVYTASHINDCFAGMKLLEASSDELIVLAMGQAGMITRILAKKYGGFLTFASLSSVEATAPGQFEISEMKNLYRWDSINEKTELFGVIGDPVGHSLSPAVFNACFDSQGINGLYLPIQVQGAQREFDEFINNLVNSTDNGGFGFGGFSVTLPHKAHALEHVTRVGEFLEPLAGDIGAVNTLKLGIGGRVSGYNTDYAGAMGALCAVMGIEKHQLHQVSVAMVGAGGVGRAVIAGLAEVGAHVTIYNRTVEKAAALAEEFNCKYAGLDELEQMDAEVIINCTSIGMHPDVEASPVPKHCLKEGMTIFDTVYNPLETLLLEQAKAVGAKTVDGAEMFVRQAMAQFKLFTGQEADEDVMRKTVFGCLCG